MAASIFIDYLNFCLIAKANEQLNVDFCMKIDRKYVHIYILYDFFLYFRNYKYDGGAKMLGYDWLRTGTNDRLL
jgi:hypothetical protein